METRRVPVFSWVLTFILLAIPLVNVIYFIVLLFGGSKYKSKVTFIRAILVTIALGVGIFFGIMYLLSGEANDLIATIVDEIKGIIESLEYYLGTFK